MKFLVLNGPNLNLLGTREPDVYGNETLSEIGDWLSNQPEGADHELTWFQSNHEGDLIDQIHAATSRFDGVIINPGALTHYSYALKDALASITVPTVEVHLSDIYTRESFRHISLIKDECISQISGLGKTGYLEALKTLINYI